MVNLILNVDPEFRGRKSGISDLDHPNNALLTALYEAARTLLQKAAASNNSTELNETISSLLEMTKELRPDELRPIYSKILILTSVMINELVMENGNINDNLRKQFDEIINQVPDQYQ
jgi:hypothetical protein